MNLIRQMFLLSVLSSKLIFASDNESILSKKDFIKETSLSLQQDGDNLIVSCQSIKDSTYGIEETTILNILNQHNGDEGGYKGDYYSSKEEGKLKYIFKNYYLTNDLKTKLEDECYCNYKSYLQKMRNNEVHTCSLCDKKMYRFGLSPRHGDRKMGEVCVPCAKKYVYDFKRFSYDSISNLEGSINLQNFKEINDLGRHFGNLLSSVPNNVLEFFKDGHDLLISLKKIDEFDFSNKLKEIIRERNEKFIGELKEEVVELIDKDKLLHDVMCLYYYFPNKNLEFSELEIQIMNLDKDYFHLEEFKKLNKIIEENYPEEIRNEEGKKIADKIKIINPYVFSRTTIILENYFKSNKDHASKYFLEEKVKEQYFIDYLRFLNNK